MKKRKNCIDCDRMCCGLRCKSCSNRLLSLKRSLYDKLDLTTLSVDVENMSACDANGNKVPVKMGIPFACILCKREYIARIINEKQKVHPWHCKSCAISLEWKNDTYYQNHRLAKLGLDCKAIAIKAHITRRANLVSGFKKLKVSHGKRSKHNGVVMRSTYEARYAKVLDREGYTWEFEPKSFLVLEKTKTYTPDFYVKDFDVYVEVKGWWRDDAKEKFDSFIATYPDIRYSLVEEKTLKSLENGDLNFESCIVEKRRSAACV